MAHGFQPVGNHNDRLIVGQFRNGLHQLLLVLRVHVSGGFVQNDDGCVLHNRPGDGNSLPLTAALHVPEPRHEIAQRGLAGAGGADDSSP